MADAPFCKLCETRHWSTQQCPFFAEQDARRGIKLATIDEVLDELNRDIAAIEAAPRSETTKRAPKGTFDRTAYQREYMRDRKEAQVLGLTVAEFRARRTP